MINLDQIELHDDTNNLIVEVFRLNGLLIATADRLVSKFGLTGARWQVLGAIAQAGEPATVSTLAKNMGLTRQSVQRLVNDMSRDRMVELRTNPNHKRAKLVVMTKKGEVAFEAALKLQGPWVAALSKGISSKQLVEAQRVLATIGERLLNAE